MVSSHSRRTNRRRAVITAAAMTAPIAAAMPNNTPTIACKHATQALWKAGFSEDIKIHYTQQRTPLYPIIINDNSYKEEISSNFELKENIVEKDLLNTQPEDMLLKTDSITDHEEVQ